MYGDNYLSDFKDSPYFCKIRKINENNNCVLVPTFEYKRHWKTFYKINEIDIHWNFKKSEIVWRGVSTGNNDSNQNIRINFCKKYSN